MRNNYRKTAINREAIQANIKLYEPCDGEQVRKAINTLLELDESIPCFMNIIEIFQEEKRKQQTISDRIFG